MNLWPKLGFSLNSMAVSIGEAGWLLCLAPPGCNSSLSTKHTGCVRVEYCHSDEVGSVLAWWEAF